MSDELERALDRLAEDRSPRRHVSGLDEEERRMLRMAQLLRGSRHAVPDPGFRSRLQERVNAAGGARVSRRAAFLSGIGALAAGILGGLGLGRLGRSGNGATTRALVGKHGTWFAVAQIADIQDGAVRPFNAGAVQGVLIRQGAHIHAVSRICTHMGCALGYQRSNRRLVCPCHGAAFGLDGKSIAGPGGYTTTLPPLARLRVRTNGDHVEVWSVAVTAPREPGGDSSDWT